jgi:DNA-binding response OmpR family regulator
MNFFNRHRVLYAEDNEDSCLMVRIMCELSGLDVVIAKTVAEALRLALSEHFDLYLLDSHFPEGDGLELCRRLRSLFAHTPILIYSGRAFETDKKNGLAAGADDYLTKPYLGDIALTIRQNIELDAKIGPGNGNNQHANIVAKDEMRAGEDHNFQQSRDNKWKM